MYLLQPDIVFLKEWPLSKLMTNLVPRPQFELVQLAHIMHSCTGINFFPTFLVTAITKWMFLWLIMLSLLADVGTLQRQGMLWSWNDHRLASTAEFEFELHVILN